MRCDIDVIDGRADNLEEIFVEKYYARSRPVIIRHVVEEWIEGRAMLTRPKMLLGSHARRTTFQTSRVPYSTRDQYQERTISDFVKKCMRGSKKKTIKNKGRCVERELLFDRVEGNNTWAERATRGIPKLATLCMKSYPRPASVRRPQIIVSPPFTGAPFHDHQHAINALFYGAKEWMLGACFFFFACFCLFFGRHCYCFRATTI